MSKPGKPLAKRASTLFLKAALCAIGLAMLAVCALWLPGFAAQGAADQPSLAYLQYPFLVYVYSGTIPFFVALYQAFKLLGYIGQGRAFSARSLRTLQVITYCALVVIGLIALGELFVLFGVSGDRTHVIALGLLTMFAAAVIATFAAVLEKLLASALVIKSENDLTV